MYRHYRDKLVHYIDRVNDSPDHVRKTVFMITVSLLVGLAFVGWLISLRALYPAPSRGQLFQESETKTFGSDMHSILNALQERLKSESDTNATTPPAYFLDTGTLPSLNKK